MEGSGRRDSEPCAEVIPERDFELGAGFDDTEAGIAAVAAGRR